MHVTFLSAGPAYELGGAFANAAVMTSISIINIGNGAREIAFYPPATDPGINGAVYRRMMSETTNNGITADVYQRDDVPPLPPQWLISWDLSSGKIYTHVRGSEGLASTQTVLDHVTIEGTHSVTPTLMFTAPAFSDVQRKPKMQERLRLQLDPSSFSALDLLRPANLSPGQEMTTNDGYHEPAAISVVRGAADVDVSISGRIPEQEALNLARQARDQLSRAVGQ
jgi:hypothetical protein